MVAPTQAGYARPATAEYDGHWRHFVKSRLAATIALAAAVMLGASGCTFAAEIATEKEYDPSDGVGTTVGDLAIRNALLIGDDVESLNLVFTVANTSEETQRLTIQWEAGGTRESEVVSLPPQVLTSFGGPEDDTAVTVTGADTTLGSLFPVFFTYGDAEGSEILVPVLDGALPEYELFVPSGE